MKKAAIFLLAIMYVAITSGVVVNVHYCMGKIASVKYGAEKGGDCENCGMARKKGCCHTEHKLVGLEQADLSTVHHLSFTSFAADIPTRYYSCATTLYAQRNNYFSQYHSPPDNRTNSLRLYNCVFRI